MVRILKDAGADVNMKDKSGKTALIHACELRCNDVVKILIQHANICPDLEDLDGNTALIHSANIGNDVALELLVKNFRRLGLNVDHYNKAGYTALHVATTNGFIQCAKVLAVKGKATLTLKDKVHQMTPLEWCLKEGYQKSEVDFLKPSAKFYRVAKLTTTMAKYRKKSTQESSLTSQSLPRTESSPTTAKITEKPKSKVKSLLRRTKMHSKDEPELTGDGAASSHSQKPTANKSNERSAMSKFLEKSKTTFFLTRDSHKHALGKTPRQRSFSQSEETEAAAKLKSGLTHSKSHPITTNCLEASAGSKGLNEGEMGGGNEHQEYITIPGEYGECDTDDLDNECSDTEYGVPPGNTIRNKTSCLGESPVYCEEIPARKLETPDSSRYEYGGVYCGTSSSNSNDVTTRYTLTGRPNDTNSIQNSTNLSFCSSASYSEDASTMSCVGSTDQPYLTYDSSSDDSDSSKYEDTLKNIVDMNLNHSHVTLTTVKHSQKPTQMKNDSGMHDLIAGHTIPKASHEPTSPVSETESIDNIRSRESMSRIKTSSAADINSLYATTSHKISNSMPRPLTVKDEELGSQETDEYSFSQQTKVEYISFDHALDSLYEPIKSLNILSTSESSGSNCKSKSSAVDNRSGTLEKHRQLGSPETENEHLELEGYNNLHLNKLPITSDFKPKNVQKITRSQSECVHDRTSARKLEKSALSPQTEMEFLNLIIADKDEQENHKALEDADNASSDDEIIKEFNDATSLRDSLTNSLHCLKDNVMTFVDHTSCQDVLIQSKLASGKQRDLEEKYISSCHEIGRSSGLDDVVIDLENDIICLQDESNVDLFDGRKTSSRQANATGSELEDTLYEIEVTDDLPVCDEDVKTNDIEHIVNSNDFNKPYRVK